MNTEVMILGKTYNIRSEFDPGFMSETADLVNGRMEDLMRKAGSVPTEKIAILTAMNLAGELLQLKKQDQTTRENLRKKARKLLQLIDSHI